MGQALQAGNVKVLNQPTGELAHAQKLTLPAQMESAILGDWEKLYWSLRLNGKPHMALDILDSSETGKVVFKVDEGVQNGTYEILVRLLNGFS
jgi:hypothetical protein